MGFGKAQLKTALLGGAVWLADGSELLLISTVTRAVGDEWNLTPAERGSMVSVVFIGVLIGNMMSGPVGDTYGRRLPILCSMASIFIFSILSALSWGFWSLIVFRCLVGMSFGLGQPSVNTLTTEMTPAKGRIMLTGGLMCMFSIGEMYSAVLIAFDDAYMINIHWRSLLIFGAIPSLVFGILAFFFLLQSPLFLCCHGRYSEATDVLQAMRTDNLAEEVPITFRINVAETPDMEKQQLTFLSQVQMVFNKEFMITTSVVVYSTFVLNLGYYGSLYAFPQVMAEIQMGGTPAMNLFLGAVFEILGVIMGVYCGMKMDRLPAMRMYLILFSGALCAFAIAAPLNDLNWIMTIFLYGGYWGIKFFTCIGFLVVYQYAAEVYPTPVRNTGMAICLAGGRVAAIIAPLLFELMLASFHTFVVFFYLIAVCAGLNWILVWFLPFETAGMLLKEGFDDIGKPAESDYGGSSECGSSDPVTRLFSGATARSHIDSEA